MASDYVSRGESSPALNRNPCTGGGVLRNLAIGGQILCAAPYRPWRALLMTTEREICRPSTTPGPLIYGGNGTSAKQNSMTHIYACNSRARTHGNLPINAPRERRCQSIGRLIFLLSKMPAPPAGVLDMTRDQGTNFGQICRRLAPSKNGRSGHHPL